MYKTNHKPTPLFAQLKEDINNPEISTQETPLARCNLDPRNLHFKTPEGTRIVEICEIIARTSQYELSINGRKFEPVERTEFLLYSEEGVVTINLDRELLLPIANQKMAEEPWSFTVSAQSRDGMRFLDQQLLFSLPSFRDRTPNAEHFQRLLDPSTDTELNVIRIFAQVLMSHFWQKSADTEFEATYGHDGEPFTVSGGSGYLCEITG
jgi:hypothetical protein